MRNNDTRCCGTGTCMINAEGYCWCGQRWDGEKMCPLGPHNAPSDPPAPAAELLEQRSGGLPD